MAGGKSAKGGGGSRVPSHRVRRYAARHGLDYDQAMIRLFHANEKAARLLDSAVKLPLIGRVGFDALIGLAPVAGDIVGKLFALSIIANASQLGAPRRLVWRMIGNSAFDLAIGAIPVIGDAFDVFFRANNRNIRLLRRHLEQENLLPPGPPGS
ncbi:MAG TPA: DUF4112 domain-containing protein [Candidatus Krumholzibacteria bacterium]|nr:DUF4112 domain-containing protein [Candidatus Krumholzibacteria bacterium]HPD72923.1 DUF4112 domain-containing protein [Candidatus Krumholzibacteria bacterium]HRY41722.1 DUF4112 domain-containing protein [Candidatus Krumholzibacteria bacterium]